MSSSKEFQGVSSCYVFKSRLQEYAQKNKFLTPAYETLKEGPPHEPYFRSSVTVNNLKYDSLPGFCSRKAAEQSAAEVALVELAKLGNTNDSIRNPVHESGLCKNLLQEYAQKMNYAVPSYVCQMGETRGKGTAYTSTVDIGGIQYIGAAARTKKEAKLKAAGTALLAIQSSTYGSHTSPGGNCQLTVLPPIKKAPESAAALDITKKSLKPRNNKLKKKWQKNKFPKKNGNQGTTDPTGEASGIIVTGNADNSTEIHAQGSGAVDARMSDQSVQNVTSSNGSVLERLPAEEASGHTPNTNIENLGSTAIDAMMDMDIPATQEVESANGSGLERWPAKEVYGMAVVRNTENTTEIQAQGKLLTELSTSNIQALGSAAMEAITDMDIPTREDVESANGSGLERSPAGEVYGMAVVKNTGNTTEIQAQGAAAAGSPLDMDTRCTQIGDLAYGNGLVHGNTIEIQAQSAAAAEGHQDMDIQSKQIGELANGSGFERMTTGAASENGTESGGSISMAEAKLTFPEIKLEVQNDQGFPQKVESESRTRSGLERLLTEANQSTSEIKLEVQNDQGFSQDVEPKNVTRNGLQELPAEAEKSLQEVRMEIPFDQGSFQNFELQNGTSSNLDMFPAEEKQSVQDDKVEVQNGQGFSM